MRILKAESYRRGIVFSTIFNIINKGLVFLNSVVIAYYFGAQFKIDIYFYAYNTIFILATFITNLNASVVIPESMKLRTHQREQEVVPFLNFFFYLYVFITVFLCLIFLVDPVRIFALASSFRASELQEHVQILFLIIPLFFLIPVVNLLTDILASYKFFSVPMIVGILNGLFSILFLFFFHEVLDIYSLLIGLLLSYSINLALLIYLMKTRLNWTFGFKWLRIEKRIWKNVFFAQAGNITSSLSSYAPLYLLSGFNIGMITSLNFARQISTLPTALVTNQFSTVAGIKFNELYSKQDFKGVNRIYQDTISFLLFILIPVSGIFYLFPSEIVSVLLGRGAFTTNNVAYTAMLLQYLGLILPLLAIDTLFSRLFMASHQIRESFWYQIVFNVVLIIAIYFNIQWLGFVGYPLTLVAVYLLSTGVYYLLEKRYFNIIAYQQVLKKFLLIAGINVVVGFIVYWIIKKWAVQSAILSLIAGGGLYLAFIVVIGYFGKTDKTFRSFIDHFLERIGGRHHGMLQKKLSGNAEVNSPKNKDSQ